MRAYFVRRVPDYDDVNFFQPSELESLEGVSVLATRRHAVAVDSGGMLAIWRVSVEPRGLVKIVSKLHQSLGVVALDDATTTRFGHCLSATTEKTIWRWDLQASRAVHIYDAATSSDLERMIVRDGVMVTGGNDKRVSVWPLAANAPLASWRAHEGSVRALALHGHELVSAGADRRLCFWDTRRLPTTQRAPEPVRELTTEWDVRALAFSEDGQELSFGEGAGKLSRLRGSGGYVMRARALTAAAAAVNKPRDAAPSLQDRRSIEAVLYLGSTSLLYTQGSDLRVWFNDTQRSHFLTSAPERLLSLSLVEGDGSGLLAHDSAGNMICWMFGGVLERLQALSRAGEVGDLAKTLEDDAHINEAAVGGEA